MPDMTAGEWALWVMAASSVVIAFCYFVTLLRTRDGALVVIDDEYQDFMS